MGISRSHGDFNHSVFVWCIWRDENICRHLQLQRRKTLNCHSENARCSFYWQFVDGWSMTKKKHKHPQKKVFGSLPQGCLWFAERDLEERKCIYATIYMYIYIRIFFIFLIVVGPKLPASNWLTSRFGSVACFFCCISPKDTTAIFSSKSHGISTFNFTVSVCNGFFFHCFSAMYWRCTWCSTGPAFEEFQSSIRTSASRPTSLAAFCGERFSNWVRISLRA